MEVSKKGLELLKEFEGVRKVVYLDQAGLPTVGVGHLILPEDNLKVGDTISNEQVNAFLLKDLKTSSDFVNLVSKVNLTQNQFDALVSLCFNIGRTAFKNSTVLRRLNRGEYQGAAQAFMMWNKIKKRGKLVPSNGLSKRRQREQALFLS